MVYRKKILFLHNSLDIGGAEKLRLMLLRNIDKDKYDIKLCCIGYKGGIGKELEKLGYKIHELKLEPRKIQIRTIFRLIKYLKTQEIDILHTSLFFSNFYGRIAALICRIPYVITEEHSEHYQYQKFKHLFFILSDFFLSKITKVIVCCSETMRKNIIKLEKLNPNKVVTIQNCIDPSLYEVKEDRASVRRRYNVSEDELMIITPAFLTLKKGHIYFLKALQKVKTFGGRFKCFFAGDGPLKEELQLKTRDLMLEDDIIFLGRIENVNDYLNASDIFVLPSLKEGLPVALIEAMYMKLGCVVTDVGSNRELIKNYVNGFIVRSRDANKLAESVLYYFRNKGVIKEFGAKCKEAVENSYLIGQYVENFYKIWDEANVKK